MHGAWGMGHGAWGMGHGAWGMGHVGLACGGVGGGLNRKGRIAQGVTEFMKMHNKKGI